MELLIASCALTKCSEGFPKDSKEYEYWSQIEAMGNSEAYADARAQLVGQTGIDEYAKQYMDDYGLTEKDLEVKLFEYGEAEARWDAHSVHNKEIGWDQRVEGALQAAGGAVEIVGGVVSCADVVTCTAGVVLAASGVDNLQAGGRTVVTGDATKTLGAQGLEALGIPSEYSEIVYAGVGLGGSTAIVLKSPKTGEVITATITADNKVIQTSGDSVSWAGKGAISPQGYNVDPNKFDYFFGKVTTGNPHNIQRSAQNLKDLNTLGIKTEQQLISVFNKAASEGTVISQKSNNYGTTITKSISVSDKGAIQVSFFYPNGNLNTTPKITTIIPKLSGGTK